jgi:SOS response regulatory protein OraA/RecX
MVGTASGASAPVVTRLRATRSGRVAVEVDGARWRTLPEEVVGRTGLSIGLELERPVLRRLRRELRRHRALAAATRALRTRQLSARRLDERLQRAGFVERERAEVLDILSRAGFLDDENFALARAELLAERGGSDALIRHDLRAQGVDEESCAHALAVLEPESSRAARVAASRGGGAAAARYLARRGFGEDAIESAVQSESL